MKLTAAEYSYLVDIVRRVLAVGSLRLEEFTMLEELGLPIRDALAEVFNMSRSNVRFYAQEGVWKSSSFLMAMRHPTMRQWIKEFVSPFAVTCDNCGHLLLCPPCEHCWDAIQPKISPLRDAEPFEMSGIALRVQSGG